MHSTRSSSAFLTDGETRGSMWEEMPSRRARIGASSTPNNAAAAESPMLFSPSSSIVASSYNRWGRRGSRVAESPTIMMLEDAGVLADGGRVDFDKIEMLRRTNPEALPAMKYTQMSIYPPGLVSVSALRPSSHSRTKVYRETVEHMVQTDTISSSLAAINAIRRERLGADGDQDNPCALVAPNNDVEERPITNLQLAAQRQLGFHTSKTGKLRDFLETFESKKRDFLREQSRNEHYIRLRERQEELTRMPPKKSTEDANETNSNNGRSKNKRPKVPDVVYNTDVLHKASISAGLQTRKNTAIGLRSGVDRFEKQRNLSNPQSRDRHLRQQLVLEDRLAELRVRHARAMAESTEAQLSPEMKRDLMNRSAASTPGLLLGAGGPNALRFTPPVRRPATALGVSANNSNTMWKL